MSERTGAPPEPSAAKPAIPEASIEEIIASISRIIAADNRARAPSPIATGKTGVLELTEMIEHDGSIRKLPAAGAPADGGAPQTTVGAVTGTGSLDPPSAAGPQAILSPAAAATTAAAFSRLAAAVRDRRAAPDVAVGERGRTLEDLVNEALQPMLQAWLDERLPGIVERLVREQIERLVADPKLG